MLNASRRPPVRETVFQGAHIHWKKRNFTVVQRFTQRRGGVKQGGLEGLRWGTPEPEKEPLPFEEKHGNLNPKPSTKPESLNPKPSTLNKADPALRRFDGSQEGTDRRELEPIGGAARGGLKGFWVV